MRHLIIIPIPAVYGSSARFEKKNYLLTSFQTGMVISTDSVWDAIADELTEGSVIEYENATVYGDFEMEDVLHRGKVRLLPNSWVVLPTGRLLSPEAVHHIDP